MFNVLRDSENDNDIFIDYQMEPNEDKFTHKEVDMLYKYFVDEGLSNKKQIKYFPQNWRISKEHIYASLRRNNGDVHKAGKDLSELIKNENFDIRTFYAQLNNGEFVASENNSVYVKPYLSGQEWLINPEEGMYLLNNDTVFKIHYVSFRKNGYFTLDKVITSDYNYDRIEFSNKDVIYGKYKQIKKENIQKYLEKEYKSICNELEKVSKDQDVWMKKQWKKREEYSDSIQDIINNHNNNCTLHAKLNLVCRFDLPIEIITNIISYNIESICNHEWKIRDIEYTINDLDYKIDKGYYPYNNLKWKKEVAYHVLRGDYKEWLDDMY
jgi:hypothetical protein